MNILNKPTATYEQCEQWLRSKKTANKLAFQNLPILWNAAVSNGVDPVVLIAQAMTETGFFNFGGVIDSSFHNTCGLKSTKGGSNYAANAHMRFKTWEDGIQAHADHLALYAGSPNCPKYSPDCASHTNKEYKYNGTTKDPRHFTYLHGKCKTVESLKGTWATDPKYDTKLLTMIKEIKNTKVEPTNGSVNNAKVPLNTDNKTTVKNKTSNVDALRQAIKDAALKPFGGKFKK